MYRQMKEEERVFLAVHAINKAINCNDEIKIGIWNGINGAKKEEIFITVARYNSRNDLIDLYQIDFGKKHFSYFLDILNKFGVEIKESIDFCTECGNQNTIIKRDAFSDAFYVQCTGTEENSCGVRSSYCDSIEECIKDWNN